MRARETAETRHREILRQLARAPDGLRVSDIKGLGASGTAMYLRELIKAGQVEAVPLQESTSNRPRSRYLITEAGRKALA